MIKKIHISIIIPLYNKGALIIDAIESVLAQSYQHYELIIVDDGSTDNTLEYVAPYLKNKKISLISQDNKGPGAARNTGVKQAKYPWVSFIDADDIWHCDFLQHATESLIKNPDCPFFFSTQTTDSTLLGVRLENELAVFQIDEFISSGFSSIKFKRYCDKNCGNMLANRERFIAMGGYFEPNKCTYGEDSYLNTIVFFNNPVILSDRATLLWRKQDDGLMSQSRKKIQRRPLVYQQDVFLKAIKAVHVKQAKQYIAYLALLDSRKLSRKGFALKAIHLVYSNWNWVNLTNIKMIRYLLTILLYLPLAPLLRCLNWSTKCIAHNP